MKKILRNVAAALLAICCLAFGKTVDALSPNPAVPVCDYYADFHVDPSSGWAILGWDGDPNTAFHLAHMARKDTSYIYFDSNIETQFGDSIVAGMNLWENTGLTSFEKKDLDNAVGHIKWQGGGLYSVRGPSCNGCCQ